MNCFQIELSSESHAYASHRFNCNFRQDLFLPNKLLILIIKKDAFKSNPTITEKNNLYFEEILINHDNS